jgi:hypothetical protein
VLQPILPELQPAFMLQVDKADHPMPPLNTSEGDARPPRHQYR